jgi:hypothetical protein
MIKTLNILNGDACIDIMKKADIEGDFLPWRDFLHEGSVPAHLSLKKLSKIRARFIADYGFGNFKDIHQEFIERNYKLSTYKLYDKIVLWFEHDLYDQLQLIQVLSWFGEQDLEELDLRLICTNNYLGESSAQQIKKLLHYETPVSKEHFDLAKEAWSAFTNNDPRTWAKLLDKPTSILPFLQAAIYRMLEEYPSTKHGLSRTEYQTLLVISNGIDNPIDIFVKCQTFEERKFMGDAIFWKILEGFEKYNLIKKYEGKIGITTLGKEILQGKENWLNIKPIQRSIGGVNLNKENLWCWDLEEKSIKAYYYSKPLKTLLKIK